MEVYGEEMFNGLACPPLEDFAFNFVSDDAAMNLDADIFFDDQIEEEEDVSDHHVLPIRLKRQQQQPRKGKELKRVIEVLKPTQDQLNWIAKCLKEDDQEAQSEADDDDDPIVNKKINIKPIKAAEQKRKEDAVSKINQLEEYCDKKVVLDESSIQLKFESTKRKLHDSYQRIEDAKRRKKIQLKFESTKRKLHDSYQRIEDAKRQKKIQLIEFQNPMPKPKPKPKSMGSMKKNCLGGKKCYKFHHPIAIPQY